MKNITKIFTTLFFALSTMPVFALTVSGTVSDKDGPLAGAGVRPLDANGTPIPNKGQTTNAN
ncbi:MAG: hypothetical protein J5611_00945, partial [Alphaproteobacteria bacterium]|nr:hypothetical protein [Alphaproteobacteria bacterium]